MTNNVETRTFLCTVERRDDEKHGRVIEGRPIVFGQRTDLGFCEEDIRPGAVSEEALKDVRFLVNHNVDMIPLARSRNNNENSTMQLTVDDEGVFMRADLDVERNQTAAELDSAVERGDVSGMSFMFTVDGEEWEGLDSERPVRHITSISQIFEVSAVTWPAYEQTSINARSLDSVKASLDSAKEALESARRSEELRKQIIERSETLCSKRD